MLSKCVAVLAVALIASAIAAPFQDDDDYQSDQPAEIRQCASTCPTGTNTKFAYMSGQTYSYQYDADIKTSIPGSTEHSSLHIQARANIEVISTCEMVLRLDGVTLKDSTPTQYENRQFVDQTQQFATSLQSKPLRFGFIDGTIENVCPSDNEEVWVLNIKRGILSTLQVTMATLQGVSDKTESDVSGVCPVKYDVSSSWGTLKLKKTKNLLGCTERSSAQTAFQTVGYKAPSNIQALPLLQGTQECNQEVNGRSKILTKSECKEVHVFKPFNNDESGATTEIIYKLIFQKQSEGINSGNVQSRSRLPLVYDHSVSEAEMIATVRDAQETLSQLCRQTTTDVRPEAPALFATLVRQMRRLDSRNLRQLQASSKSGLCPKAETFYRDALPVLGTAASVAMIRDLITRGQVTGTEAELLLTSITFIKNPTTETMRELQALLSADLVKSALPVSSVVHTYCKQNERDSPEVSAIIKAFEDELRYNCRVDGGDASRVLLALRAIGNAGNADRVTPTLNRCALNEDAPMAVRIAAVAAYRRISCSSSREEMLRLFETRQQDSELRIAAYLSTMQCADQVTLGRIRTVLEAEEVNQVGSFVWSHLTNLAESASPLKSDIQDLLTDAQLLHEFDVDKRKFSRNIELSTFNEMLNLGASVESNLIWSTQSYIPRSASVNLTVDLFGQSMNLIEVGGRAQGLEQLMEKYFGPGSEFDKQRDKRAVIRDDVISNIDRKYTKSRDTTQLSYYLRVFGNEIKSGDIYNLDVEQIKNKFNVLDLLVQMAQDRSVDFTRSFAVLDTDVAVPTATGMPLRLSAEATATVALNAKGKIDVRKMFSSPSTFDITGSVRPSAAVEFQGEFGVDATVTRTKLRVSNTLHSSTLLDGKLTLKDGQVFNAEWNMPQDKMEIFSAESHFYISHRGQEREQTVTGQKLVQNKRCTDPTVSNKVGLELCGELSYPTQTRAKFPLSGPAVFKVYMNKLDTFTGARLEASIIRSQNVDTARFSFKTPGSRVDRELTADFKLDRPKKELAVNVKSPWKKVAITGQVVDQPTLKSVELRAVVDDTQEYSFSTQLAITDQTGTEIKYTPSAKILIPGRHPITLDGELTYVKKRKVFGKVAIRNALSEPITAEGSVELQDKRMSQKYDANIQFSSPIIRGSLKGYVSSIQDNGNAWSSRADINYQYKNGQKQRIVFNHKIRDSSSANLKSFSADGSWTTTMWPRYNGNFAIEEQYSPTSVKTKIEAGFDNERRITIVQNGAFDFTGSDKKFNGMVKFELPYKKWNYEVKLDHIHNGDQLQSNSSVKYDEKEHTFDLGVRKDNTQYLSVYGEAKLKIAGYSPMTLTNTLREKVPREYHNELNVGAPRRTIRSVSVYKMGQRHEFSHDMQMTGYDPITIKAHLNPSPMNLQARAEVRYGAREYMADLSWLHRGTPQAFNTRAAGEVGYLGNKFGLSGEVSKRNQDFSFSAEAKTGNNKKISVSGQVTASITQPKADIRLDWPGNFISVTSSAMQETGHWYHTTNDLEAKVNVKTSFRGFEEMGGNIKIDIGQDSLKTNGEVIWAPNQKITGDLSYDKSRAGFNLATPFSGFRTIKGDMTYQLRGRSLNGNAQLQWEAKTISITGSSTYDSGRGYAMKSSGQLTINTPWSGYRLNKVTWSHENDEGTMWKCHHEVELENSNKYVLDVDATNNGVRGRSHQMNVKVMFTSPIENWRQVGVNWESNHEYQTIRGQGRGSVTWGSKIITVEHEINIQPYSTLVAKAKITTPYRGYEVMAVDLDNRLNPRSNAYTLMNEITLGDPRSKVNIGGTLSFNGPTFNAGLRIITPIENMPRIVVNARNGRQQDGSWALHADAEYSPTKSYSLDAKLSMDRTYGAELIMTSPHQYLRTLNAKAIAVVTSPKKFDVTVELAHNMMSDRIKFDSSVDVETIRSARITASLQTPFSEISTARMSLSHIYDTREKCTTSATYQLNDKRGQLTHEQTIRAATNFEGRTRVEYLSGRSITFEHKVDLNAGHRSTITASLVTPYRQVNSLDLMINVDGSLNSFRSTGEMTYNRQDKISASLDHTMDLNNGVLKSSLRIVTPYSALQRFVLTIDHSGSGINNQGPNWNALTETSMEINDKRWYGRRSVELRDGAVKLNVKTESPYQSTRSMEFNFEHTPRTGRSGNGWSNNAWLDLNGKRYNGESEYLWIGKELRAKIKTNTPDEYSIILNHKAENNEISTNIKVNGGSHLTGTVTFKMDSTGAIDARAQLDVPRSRMGKFEVSLKHEGSVNNFRSTVTVVTAIREYENFGAVLVYRGNPNDFTSSLEVTTPLTDMPKITARVNHRYSTSAGLSSGASVEYQGKKISTDVTYKNDRRTVNAKINVNTPYKGYETISAEIEHSGSSWRSFRTNGKLTTSNRDLPQVSALIDLNAVNSADVKLNAEVLLPSGKMSAVYSHSRTPSGDIRCSLQTTTPFQGLENPITAEIDHQEGASRTKISARIFDVAVTAERTGTLNNLSLKAEVRTNGIGIKGLGRTAASWTHTVGEGSFDVKAQVETSLEKYEKMGITWNTATKRGGVKSTGTLETSIPGHDRYTYNIDHSMIRRNVKTSVEMNAPYPGYEKIGASVDYTAGQGEGFRVSVQLNTPFQKYKNFALTINHAGTAAQFETTGRISTPFNNAQQIDYTVRHRGSSISDFTTMVSAEYSGKRMEVETSFKLNQPSRHEVSYEGSLKIATPCPYVRDLSLVASHNRKPELKSGALAVTLNSEKKIDMDYSYTTDGTRNIVINIRDPYPMATNLNMRDSTGSAVVNWDTTNDNKKVRFDFGFKDIETSSSKEKSLSFKVILPRRAAGFSWGYTLSPERFTNRGELMWNTDGRPDFVYEIQGSKSERRSMNSYEAGFKVTSRLVNWDTTFSHKSQSGRKYMTEIGLQSTDKLAIKSDMTMTGPSDFSHTITLQHPRFNRDINLITETKNGNSFTSTLNFDRQTVTLEGRLVNEAPSTQSMRYSGMLRLAHPNSFTDVKLSGLINCDAEKSSGNIKVDYQTSRDRQIQTAELRAEINRIRRELNAELSTPMDTYKLTTVNRELNDEAGVLRYDVTASCTHFNYRSTVDFSARDRSCDVKLFNTDGDSVQLFTQFYSPTRMTFDLSRIQRGQKINDVRVALSRSDDRILTGYSSIRPDILREIQSYVYNSRRTPSPVAQEWSRTVERLTSVAKDDLDLKSRYFSDAITPLRSAYESLTNDFNSKVAEIKAAFNDAYRRDDFYMRQIHQALKRQYDDISRRVQYKLIELQRGFQSMKESMQRTNQMVAQKFNEAYDWLESETRDVRNDMNERMQRTKMYFEESSRNIQAKMMENTEAIRRHPFIASVSNLKAENILQLPGMIAQYIRGSYEQLMYSIQTKYEQTAARPDVIQIRESIIRWIQANKWLFQYLGLEGKVNELMQKMNTMNWQTMKAVLEQSLTEFIQWNRNRWTKFDPQRGEYEFEVYMPIDVPDMTWVRQLDMSEYLANLKRIIDRYVPKDDWTLMDTIYAYKPKSDRKDWVPPFKAHASLVGSQHYVTFDKKFFDFAADCSYLLARDFMDKTFSVVVNYERASRGQPIKKSISVLTDGKQIEIMQDAKVTMDGSRIEMPFRVGNTTVSRQESSVVVKTDLGLEVNCDLPHDHCTVAMPGWYYAKTAGLLGTYDNEASNDFTTSDKTIADRPDTFAETWNVGSRCRTTNRVTSSPVDKNTRRYRACAAVFSSDSSPFRSCFLVVPAEPYLTMCVNDVTVGDNSLEAQEDTCRVAAAYYHECKRQEAHVRMPSQCVQCEVSGTSDKFYEGDVKTLENEQVPQAADVIFVVQHAPCNRDVIEKAKGIVDDLDKAFRTKGIKSTQYSVVGFGGVEHLNSAQIRTMDGQIFSSASKVSTAFNNFDLQAGSSPDAMAALIYAAKLPFRAGASKSIILLPCDSCKEQSTRYSDLQRVLIQSDIRLHVLVQDLIQLKSRSPKTSLIFGVDKSTVYTGKDVSGAEIEGEPDLRKYIRMPKDLCVALTQDTDGSVFSLRQWLDSRTNIQKKFADVFVRMVANKGVPPECQYCECVTDSNGVGVSECRSCYQRSALLSLMPNFNGADYSDSEVSETKPQESWATPAPRGTLATKRPGDRVNRDKRPRKTPPPRKIPPKPQVKDQ